MIALYVDGRVDLDAGLDTIEAAIRGLDGAESTLVVVELPSGATLTVGGGPDKVVAELAVSSTERWCVVDPRRPAGTVELIVGGQRVAPPARVCIDKASALEAARTFVAEHGARSPRLEWSAEAA